MRYGKAPHALAAASVATAMLAGCAGGGSKVQAGQSPAPAPSTEATVPTPMATSPSPSKKPERPGGISRCLARPGGAKVSGVGDSVMLGAAPKLRAKMRGIVIDAEVGRQMTRAIPVLKRLRASGRLRQTVIIGLGTNGPFDVSLLRRTLDAVGDNRRVLLVSTRVPRSWQAPVNEKLRRAAKANPRVRLVDWHSATREASGALQPDGIHLRPAGASRYANLIVKSVCEWRS